MSTATQRVATDATLQSLVTAVNNISNSNVKYTAQSLSTAAQEQARENIGCVIATLAEAKAYLGIT